MRFRRNARSKLVSLDKAQTIPEAAVMDESTPEKLFYRSELQRVFQEVFTKLPSKHRAVIVMKEYQGLKFREISEILEIPISTVKSRLYLGLKTLKALVEKNYEL